MKVLVINPGATSTKLAAFDEQTPLFSQTIEHPAQALAGFDRVIDQAPMRMRLIEQALFQAGLPPEEFDAVCGRGGLLRHVPSGTYEIDDAVLYDVAHPPYGEHASNLGVLLASELARRAGIPAYFVDPVSVDELSDLARVSGYSPMQRESFFHALNQKSTARRASELLGQPYEALNLIVVHLGGGVSVAAHEKGRVVDVYNVKDDGAMGIDRGGALPVNAVIRLCFSGLTQSQVKQKLGSEAGVFSYLGTRDFREVQSRAFSGGDPQARLIFDAFAYQLAKDIGAMAAVLRYRIDAIVYTGGMAHSEPLCDAISAYVGTLARIIRLPGENEMRALADGALRVLHGEPARQYGR